MKEIRFGVMEVEIRVRKNLRNIFKENIKRLINKVNLSEE